MRLRFRYFIRGVITQDLIEQKRLVAVPDKIRRLLLRIDRLEKTRKNKTNEEYHKEVRGIIKSLYRLLYELDSQQDKNLLLAEITKNSHLKSTELSEINDYYIKTQEVPTTNSYPPIYGYREEEFPIFPLNKSALYLQQK